ncbi:MAG: DUF1501 domain-containing protein [Planctomycetota bacterium]|nr:DUF1501 domain-containing protein [Planctomycetota bacterium]
MLKVTTGSSSRNCQGISRRSAIKAGFLGLSGLTLADLMRMRANGSAEKNEKSVILLWLDGGPSQLETYDPKPEAPSEYRGPFETIATNVPGMNICETLPLHAKMADKMAFVRSVHHGTGDHFAGAHYMLTGKFGSTSVDLPQKYPSVGSYISKVKGPNKEGMPAYVGLPSAQSVYLFPGYQGAAYLGPAYNPFNVDSTNVYLGATYNINVDKPQCLENFKNANPERSDYRKDLLSSLDNLKRGVDQSGMMDAIDKYQQDAMSMILSGKAQEAFNLEKEDPKHRAKYGPGPWGQYTLMARRLVEAGATFVTVDMPHWDDHSNIKVTHGTKLPHVDMAVSALLDDLEVRGMLDNVMILVMGEFGRTPRINNGQPGIPIPGRDHWGDAISVLMAGGGLRGGTVIGATNEKAEFPVERALKPADILATVYHALGIDYTMKFDDRAGRPVAMLDEGHHIAELF